MEKTKKQTKKKIELLLNIACANLINSKLEKIEKFTGTIKECIDFMNQNYSKRYIELKLKDCIVFNLAYKNEEELMNLDNWFSLKSLINANILEVE